LSLSKRIIRRQSSIVAIKRAKHTALDIAKSVNLALGKPFTIVEEETKILEDSNLNNVRQDTHQQVSKTFQDYLDEKTIQFKVKLNVVFELKPKLVTS
jgi:uncharacterized protein YggE